MYSIAHIIRSSNLNPVASVIFISASRLRPASLESLEANKCTQERHAIRVTTDFDYRCDVNGEVNPQQLPRTPCA